MSRVWLIFQSQIYNPVIQFVVVFSFSFPLLFSELRSSHVIPQLNFGWNVFCTSKIWWFERTSLSLGLDSTHGFDPSEEVNFFSPGSWSQHLHNKQASSDLAKGDIRDPTEQRDEETLSEILHMGVSKNRGTPKWMVFNGKSYKNGMIWGYHYFRKHPHITS